MSDTEAAGGAGAEGGADAPQQLARRGPVARAASKVSRGVKNGLTASFQNSVLLKSLVILAEVGLLAVALGLGFEPEDPGLWLSFGLGSLALFNFILFYQSDNGVEEGSIRETRSAAMRRAIAGSAITTYLLLVALLAFNPSLQESAGSNIGCAAPSPAVMVMPAPEPSPTDPSEGAGDDSGEADVTEGEAEPESGTVAADPVVVSTPADTCIGVSRDLINRLGVVVGTIAVFYFGTTTLEDLVREGRNRQDGDAPPEGDPPAADPRASGSE